MSRIAIHNCEKWIEQNSALITMVHFKSDWVYRDSTKSAFAPSLELAVSYNQSLSNVHRLALMHTKAGLSGNLWSDTFSGVPSMVTLQKCKRPRTVFVSVVVFILCILYAASWSYAHLISRLSQELQSHDKRPFIFAGRSRRRWYAILLSAAAGWNISPWVRRPRMSIFHHEALISC